MIMYFAATGRQPFANRAHDGILALDICNGIRPEINEPEIPKCYVDLMKKCWDPSPENRPNSIKIHELVLQFRKSYVGDIFFTGMYENEIEKQYKEAEEYRKANLSSIKNNQSTSHPKAYYTSRLLNPFTKNLHSVEVIDFTK